MAIKVTCAMFVLLAVLSLGQAELQVRQGGVASRGLLQATCPLANNTLPTTKDANVMAFITASQGITGFDFNRCAGLQCALYPFLAPALPASPTYDAYLTSYANPCKSRIYSAIEPLVSSAELTVINVADNACFGAANKFEYKSNDNDKKNALSCGGKLKLSAELARSGVKQVVLAVLAAVALKMVL